MNKYNKRLIWTVFWLCLFIVAGIVDWRISLWNNDYTLSKILLWLDSKSTVCYFGVVFMMGYLMGHLQAPQNPLT